jgi:hypothetical protein
MAGKTNRNDEKAALGQIRTGINYLILCRDEPLFKGIRFMQISAPEESEPRKKGYEGPKAFYIIVVWINQDKSLIFTKTQLRVRLQI